MVSPAIATPERRGLFRIPAYRFLWTASTVSVFGTYVTEVAVALLAVKTLQASPLEAGFLRAAQQLPNLLFGLAIGVWVDRLRKRPLMIGSDLLRGGFLLLIPLAALWDQLNIPLLCLVVFVVGAITVVYEIAESSFIPHVIPRDRLVEGNARLEASYAIAQTGGPAAGGLLVGLLTAPFAIVVDAVSYLLSGLLIRRIDVPEPAPRASATSSVWQEIRDGVRFVHGHAVLRPILAATLAVNFFGHVFLAVYVIYLSRDLGLSDVQIGLVFATGGLGALLGATATPWLNRRFGVGPTLVGGNLLFGVTGLLIPAAVLVPEYALPLVIGSEFLQYLCEVPFFLNALTLMQSQAPDALRGRVMSTRKVVAVGARPVASLLGGVLGGLITVPRTLVVGELGLLLSGLWLLFTPLRRMRDFPIDDEGSGVRD